MDLTPQETILDLQRKIRFISNDIKVYTEDVQSKTKKQRAQINKLKKDNQALKDDLSNLQRSKEPRPMTRTSSILDTPENYQEKIDIESKKLKEIEENIKIIQKDLFKKREKIGGINASRDNASALNKQMRILENRLDKANQKFNEAIAQNKVLREEIDNLRRERVIFDTIYQKLEKELQGKRKEMANIIESANAAYEGRDRAQDTLSSIKNQAKKEQEEFEKLWKDLNGQLEKDKKKKDFIKMRFQERDQNDHVDAPKFEEEIIKKKSKVDPQVIAAEKVKLYEEAFNKIQSATGIQDIEVLVDTFIKAEDKNFKLFKFVNELSNDIETLEKQISELNTEIMNCKEQESLEVDMSFKPTYDEKIEKFTRKIENYEKKYEESQRNLVMLNEEVTRLYHAVDYRKQNLSEILADSALESCIYQTLKLTEQRCNDIVNYFALQKGKEDYTISKSQVVPGTNLLTAYPAVKDENSGDDEEDLNIEKPLSDEEFRLRAAREASKRDQQKVKLKQNKSKSKK